MPNVCYVLDFGSLILCRSTSTNTRKYQLIYTNTISGILRIKKLEHVGNCVFRDYWNMNYKLQNFETSKPWNVGTVRLWIFGTLEIEICDHSKSWNLAILESWKLWSVETLKGIDQTKKWRNVEMKKWRNQEMTKWRNEELTKSWAEEVKKEDSPKLLNS